MMTCDKKLSKYFQHKCFPNIFVNKDELDFLTILNNCSSVASIACNEVTKSLLVRTMTTLLELLQVFGTKFSINVINFVILPSKFLKKLLHFKKTGGHLLKHETNFFYCCL